MGIYEEEGDLHSGSGISSSSVTSEMFDFYILHTNVDSTYMFSTAFNPPGHFSGLLKHALCLEPFNGTTRSVRKLMTAVQTDRKSLRQSGGHPVVHDVSI